MKKNFIDMTNRRCGRLLPTKIAGHTKRGGLIWECTCDCGKITNVDGYSLRKGLIKSCGCLLIEGTKLRFTKHGLCEKTTYNKWKSMLRRCYDPKSPAYKNYGGRGIKVCDRWRNFSNYYDDIGDIPKGLSIERIDNNTGYSPENCKIATRTEQNRNQRRNKKITYNGESLILIEWCEKLKLNYRSVASRLKRGWSVEKALTTPTKK